MHLASLLTVEQFHLAGAFHQKHKKLQISPAKEKGFKNSEINKNELSLHQQNIFTFNLLTH